MQLHAVSTQKMDHVSGSIKMRSVIPPGAHDGGSITRNFQNGPIVVCTNGLGKSLHHLWVGCSVRENIRYNQGMVPPHARSPFKPFGGRVVMVFVGSTRIEANEIKRSISVPESAR